MKALSLILSLISIAALAQEPVFLKDFNAEGADAFPYSPEIEGITVDNQLFFVVDDRKHGEELWRTNGTEVGTQLLKDINPGKDDGNVRLLTTIGNTLYFAAADPEHGYELWRTQGTASSTLIVKDINPGEASASIGDFAVLDDVIYFSASGDRGRELYRSAGTEATTYRVRDINTKTTNSGIPHSSTPQFLTAVGSTIFFTANDGEHGVELWKTDGTFGGTEMVKDITEGQFSTSFSRFKAAGNTLYFTANDGVHGLELWKSDGTESGTMLVKDITEGQVGKTIELLESVNGVFYFTVRESAAVRTLWKTDGTEEGTITVGGGVSAREYAFFNDQLFFRGDNKLWTANGEEEELFADLFISGEFAVAGNYLYFAGNESGSGNGIWRTDGTAGGTSLVKEVTSASYRYIQHLSAAGERVFFTAETEEYGNELWGSDGTAEGTLMLVDAAPGPEDGFRTYEDITFGVAGDLLLFAGWDEAHGRDLWKSDGTVEGTMPVKDIAAMTKDLQLSSRMIPFDGASYFLTNTGLWKTAGAAENTVLVHELTYPGGLHVLNGKLIFTAQSDELSRTIWLSDGTPEGTQPLFDSNTMPGSMFLFQDDLPQIDGVLFFSGRSAEHGSELWKTDGTVEGTAMVKDIYPGEEASFYSLGTYAVMDNFLYFVASDDVLGEELWKTDGTEAGTKPVTDINPFGSSAITYLTEVNGQIFFSANDGAAGYELWKTDGTTEGTAIVKDINPGEGDAVRFNGFVAFNDLLFFAADDGEHGRELWKSDGTAAGTAMVKDIYPSTENFTRSGNPLGFYVFENNLYFVAENGSGRKLWKTDGTTAGTELFMDMEAEYNAFFFDAAGSLFFSASDGEHGFELWRTVSDDNPVMVADIMPGIGSSSPIPTAYSNGILYFTAIDEVHGRELWALKPVDLQVEIESDGGSCGEGEEISFSATLPGAGDNASYQWYVNGNLAPEETGQVFSSGELQEGDEVKVLARPGSEVWALENEVFSEPVIVDFSVPVAEITVSGNQLTASEGASYEWYLDGEQLSETNRTIVATTGGAYAVKVTNATGCSAISEEVPFSVTAVKNEERDRLEIYPNPASSEVYITSQLGRGASLSVFDQAGKKMYEASLNAGDIRHQIDLRNMPGGLYIIQIAGAEGVFRSKLIKQ